MTAALAIAAAISMLNADYEGARRVDREFPLMQELFGAAIFYGLPAAFVAIGSYFHASRRRNWGIPMLVIGCLWLIILVAGMVLSPFFAAAFHQPLFAALNFGVALIALVTIVVSFAVHFGDSSPKKFRNGRAI